MRSGGGVAVQNILARELTEYTYEKILGQQERDLVFTTHHEPDMRSCGGI